MMTPGQPPKTSNIPKLPVVPSRPVIQRSFDPVVRSGKPMFLKASSADEADNNVEEFKASSNIDYSAKFGGSSVANAERMLEVFKLVKE